jgi:hypothetical protein
MRNLDQRQLATVVAALRFFNRHYDAEGQPPIAVREVATAKGEIVALSPKEVEGLAEEIAETTHFSSPERVTVLAMTTPNDVIELSGYAKEQDAWDAVGQYADIWWESVDALKGLPKPDDSRDRANAFFGSCEDGSSYEIATIELRYEPKKYAGPDGPAF